MRGVCGEATELVPWAQERVLLRKVPECCGVHMGNKHQALCLGMRCQPLMLPNPVFVATSWGLSGPSCFSGMLEAHVPGAHSMKKSCDVPLLISFKHEQFLGRKESHSYFPSWGN